jgi:hypothetical protein
LLLGRQREDCRWRPVQISDKSWASEFLSSQLHRKYKEEDGGPGQPGHKQKITKAKRAGGEGQVIEHLPSKYKALSTAK